MKIKNALMITLVAFIAFAFTAKPFEYTVDKNKSKIVWTGKKVTGSHTGNISLANGKFVVDGKRVVGGTFTIDMTSITNQDIEDETYRQKLLGHLKSDDFFSTEKHPRATLLITKLTPTGQNTYQVKGNLTIKGITKAIEFPATIQLSGNQVQAKATIVVDRTQYDIKYGSGSFFDNLGDKAIDNKFTLDVDIVARQELAAK
jgi:polyisoprenoid-binding protein YceI